MEHRLTEPLFVRPIIKRPGLSAREMLATAGNYFYRTVESEPLVELVHQYGGALVSCIMERFFYAVVGAKKIEDDKEM